MVRWKMIVLIGSGTLVSTNCERREKNQRLIPRKKKNGNPFSRWFSSLSRTDEATAVDGSLFNRDSSNVVLSGAAVVSTLPKCQITVHQSGASNLDNSYILKGKKFPYLRTGEYLRSKASSKSPWKLRTMGSSTQAPLRRRQGPVTLTSLAHTTLVVSILVIMVELDFFTVGKSLSGPLV
jgi:hypothetical protein